MKNSEKNSSKVNNNNTTNNNNNVLSPESIKLQLKAACQDMNAKETKEYIKSLAGYELRLTGQKPTQHYTVFYGEVRVCNVEQVQGIKADGTSRGCVSIAKVNFIEKIEKTYTNIRTKIFNDMTDNEKIDSKLLFEELKETAEKIQSLFDDCNNRIAEQAKEAAAAKRAEAAKERATAKMNNKLKESSDSEKIAALAAVLDISFDEAKIIFEKKRAQKTA